MSDEAVTPALTAEEWGALRVERGDHDRLTLSRVTGGIFVDDGCEGGHVYASDRHALAALCLLERPYGFTRADVALLRGVEDELSMMHMISYSGPLLALAARIAALLPPEAS